MGTPIRVAFCPVYYGANGGAFDDRGRPTWKTEDAEDDGYPIRGKCDRPFDCGTCPYLHQYVVSLEKQGWTISWECVHCLKETKRLDDEAHQERSLPGFYQSGRPQVPEDHPDYDSDQPPLGGCVRCGWASSFLQLVLRRAKVSP